MKATFESDDELEIKQIAKANDMAMLIWELYHNKLKHFDNGSREIILSLLDEFSIIPDELSC
jgi:hypothetical protein